MAKIQTMFKVFRAIAFVAIACTLAVTIFMLVQSAAPADKSSALSNVFSGENGGEIVVDGRGDDVPTTGLILSYDVGYSGETVKPSLKFTPAESTDREVIWELSTPGASEKNIQLNRQNGELTLLHLGTLAIKASLKSDPSISATCSATCMGTNPKDITSLSIPKTRFLQGDNSILRLVDQDGEFVAFHTMKLTYSDDGEHFTIKNDVVCAKAVGTSTLTVSHPDMQKKYSFDIEVVENPKYIPLDHFVANQDLIPDGQTYYVKPNTVVDFRPLITCVPEEASAFQAYSYTIQNPNGKSVLQNKGTFLLQTVKTGEAKLTITSRVDASKSITLNICVCVDKPTKLQIITSDITVVDRLYSLKTIGDEYYVDNVTYKVIKGKAQIDGSKFRPKRLGTLVIRATYDDDPTLYTDITLDVQLFDTFSSFVRKTLGHFSLFAVLGFGFTYVYIFLFKRKWISAPLALPTGLLLAMASEGLQLTAKGRYGSWTDVGVDFVGFAIGVAIALLLFGAIYLTARILKGDKTLIAGLRAVNAKTLFVPSGRVPACAQEELAADNQSADRENAPNAESVAEKAAGQNANKENAQNEGIQIADEASSDSQTADDGGNDGSGA